MKLADYFATVEAALTLSKRIGVHDSTLGRIAKDPGRWRVARKIVEGTNGLVSAEELLGLVDKDAVTTTAPRRRRRKRAA